MPFSRVPATLRVFVLALIGYAISGQVWAHPVSIAPHYVYLAHSLLSGHLDLIQLPPTTYDLLFFNNQWFVAGSPLPAVLMLPFVAIFGVTFSDVWFSVALGAINVALVYNLLSFRGAALRRRGISEPVDQPPVGSSTLSESARRWLTLLFAIGTPYWYLASLGTYWFTAHSVAVCFALLATREALTRQRWFLAGLWLAAASLARPTVLGMAPFFLVLIIAAARNTQHATSSIHNARETAYSVLRKTLPFAAALLIGVSAHGAYNLARFGQVTDFGYEYVFGAANITTVYARYGGFNPRFLPCNLAVSLATPPQVRGQIPDFVKQACSYLLEVDITDRRSAIAPNPLGMSIFLVTPALLLIFTAIKRRPLIIAAWLGLLCTLIPLWLYHNTGSLQFGWRYLFDAAPMWLILLAFGLQNLTPLKRGLILVSIAINAWGMWWMFEKIVGRSWF